MDGGFTKYFYIGLMFIEDSGAMAQEDSTAVRQALDALGAQVSSVMERRSRGVNYRTGAFLFESQPWLRIWDFGNFRSQRETGWYLGLNFGEDRHVMFYLSCAGPEHVRAKFSAHLWHHLFAVRTVMMAEASREIESNDIRTELAKFLLTDRTFKALEQISLSFSIVSRTKNTAISGHFGVARPVVINGNNRVSPGNESLMALSGGRELRYWDVESTMGEQQVLVVSYDTSKLDGVIVSSPHSISARSGSQPFDELSIADRPSELHQILASRLPVDVLPRYYVAIMRQRTARSGSLETNAETPKMVG